MDVNRDFLHSVKFEDSQVLITSVKNYTEILLIKQVVGDKGIQN